MLFELESSNFHLYGKSTQNGTPTPTNPVPIVSLYEGEELTFRVLTDYGIKQYSITPNGGLRGLPVEKSLANYTDESGQSWCCDEIDLERGVYIQRVFKINVSDYGTSSLSNGNSPLPYTSINVDNCYLDANMYNNWGMCNRLTPVAYAGDTFEYGEFRKIVADNSHKIYLYYSTEYLNNNDRKQYFIDNNYELLLILAEPIEIPLDVDVIEVTTDYKTRMNGYYPDFIRTIKEFQAIINADYPEFEQLEVAKENIIKNAHFSTMTESRIVEWEKLLQISYVEGSTLDDRRETIIARVRGKGKLNTDLINNIVNTFTGGVANSWVTDSTLYVEITPPKGNKSFIFENVEQELARKVPAHLNFKVSRNYYTWSEATEKFTTWQAVKDNFYSWNDVHIFSPF